MTKQAEQEFNIAKKFLQQKEARKNINDSDSGLERYFTYDVTTELDSCLQGQKGSFAFKRMSRDDSIIGGILKSYENPIQSARWSIEEIKDATPQETQIIDILNDWFFKRNDFGTLLSQILGMLPMGFSCFERYFTPVTFEENGIDGRYMMPILAERVQTSIRKIDYKDLLVEQQTTSSNLIYIPFKDLVFFTFRKSGNDLRGTSLLRQAYYDFLDKKEIKMAGLKGIIRSMIGLALGKAPATNIESEDFQKFNELVLDIGERSFNGLSDAAVIQEGYDIEILNSNSFDLEKMKNYIAYLDSSMTMSVLTQFMTLGQSGGGGSYSLGRDASDMFLDGLQFIIDYIGKQFSQQVIYQTVAMNWGNVDPKKFNLIGTNLNKKDSKEFADTLGSLIKNGIIKVTPEDEVKIRKMYNLSEIAIEDLEKRDEKKEEIKVEEDKEVEIKKEEVEDDNEEASNKEESKKKEVIKLSEERKRDQKIAKQRNALKDQEVEKLAKFSRASLQLIADEFSKTIRRQLNKGSTDAQGLKDLKINNIGAYKKKLGQKLSGIASQAWKNALKNSKGKIKLSEISPSDLPTQVLTSFIINQSDTMIDKQLNDIRDLSILTANTEAAKGLSVDNNIAIVDKKMDDYINNQNIIEGGLALAVIQAMNYGEMEYYRSIESDLWGYRFANDVPETQICKSLVGKVYPVNSSELDLIQPPLHFRCDSFLVPIYKSEAKPDIDNFVPPPSIMKQKTI